MFIDGRITLWTFNTDVIFLVDILHKLDIDKNNKLYDKKVAINFISLTQQKCL